MKTRKIHWAKSKLTDGRLATGSESVDARDGHLLAGLVSGIGGGARVAADQGELYDLVQDPYQLHNGYGDPAYDGVRRDLGDRMRAHMERLHDPLLRRFRVIWSVY